MAPPCGDAPSAATEMTSVILREGERFPPLPGCASGNAADMREGDAKKKNSKKAIKPRINGWGLREYSKIVSKKVEAKGRTTYNEVADEIFAELTVMLDGQELDEKNIRRRVYDAFNVLIALHVFAKDKKEIKWMGLSNFRYEKIKMVEDAHKELTTRIKNKKKLLQEIEKQFDDLQYIIFRNQVLQKPAEGASGILLPFVLVKVTPEEFDDLCNTIGIQFQKEPPPSYLEKYPSFYHSPQCERLKSFVRSHLFEYLIIFVLLVNLIAVIIETTLDIENSSSQKVWQEVEFVFGWIYVVEMALKIFSLGFGAYWMEGQSKFDFLLERLTFVFPSKLSFLSNGEWIQYLLLGRMLRLTRILLQVQRFRAFVATFFTLMSSLLPYLGIVFCTLCVYCSIGLQIFGGIVYTGNPKLEETDLFGNDYLLFNVNDYPSGMVTLFNLLVMGNWQVWMESYVHLTGTSWSLIYFVSFYLISVLLLLNPIVAFVLEAFFAEMELEKAGEAVMQDLTPEGRNKRRSMRVKTNCTKVDILLHHMLSNELDCSQNLEQ